MHLLHKKAFTLIEIIVTLAILAILASLIAPNLSHFGEASRIAVDKANLRTLNASTRVYRLNESIHTQDVFQGLTTDEQRMFLLIESGCIAAVITPQQSEASFIWNIDQQQWLLDHQNAEAPLSPLGSTLSEISSAMIDLIQQRYDTFGSYGRTWGDFAFTDIGLDPLDWQDPVGNIYYRPVGGQMRIRPEEGYRFVVNDINGNQRVLTYALNWSLVYDMQQSAWFFHSISENNRLDMTSFEIQD